MSDDYLHRDDAPFGDDVWEKIDEAVVGAARGQLTARRLFHVEGPYGYGLRSVPGTDKVIAEEDEDAAGVSAGCVTPVAAIRKDFAIPMRDVASYKQSGIPFSTADAAHAAIACARREDEILFHGSDDLGVKGLLNMPGVGSMDLSAWDEVGAAADDIIQAATMLDEAGFHGPYALALAPDRYNLLFRRYPQGNMVEADHVKNVVTEGVVKAPALESGGILVATGRWYCTIVLGQDLTAGFIGPAGPDYEFTLSETVALRLKHPGSVCVLK